MKISSIISRLFSGVVALFVLSSVQAAGSPVWTFAPLTPTTLSVPSNDTAVVQYQITNQSTTPRTLAMQSIPGVTQLTTGLGVCGSPFVLSGKASCTLSLQIDGSLLTRSIMDGPVVCENSSKFLCYRPARRNNLHITQAPPVSDATISVTGSPLTLTTHGPTGTLTINNMSLIVAATNITSNFTGTALDGNVTETGNTCANVAPQGSCTLTYTPGSTVVSQTNFPIQGSNTNEVTAAMQIDAGITLSSVSPDFGAVSGGTDVILTGVGLTDTTGVTFGGVAATGVNVVNSTTVTAVTPAHAVGAVDVVISTSAGDASLANGYTYTEIGQMTGGGIVACLNGGLNNLITALADNGVEPWGNYGVSTGATSNTDGETNTDTIVNTPNIGSSAAQVCASYAIDSQGNTPCEAGSTCYDDWFLPAGNNTETSGQLNCLYENRVEIGGFSGVNYWSSTEDTSAPSELAWVQLFSSGVQSFLDKDARMRVRCVRPFSLGPITVITPNVGPEAGETGVKIIGTGLKGATAITFDGVPATSLNAVDASTVTAITPAHAVGLVDVVISTPTGDTTLTDGYTYVTNAAGQPSGGGVIACLNGGDNDLIAATADNSPAIQWGNADVLTGATSITDGATNTLTIVNTPGIGESAAQVCTSYVVDSQGNTPCQEGNTCYDDWFLPAGNNAESSGQLNCLYTNRTAIGNFSSSDFYWSSTESTELAAWQQFFGDGGAQSRYDKFRLGPVRCVRAFTP